MCKCVTHPAHLQVCIIILPPHTLYSLQDSVQTMEAVINKPAAHYNTVTPETGLQRNNMARESVIRLNTKTTTERGTSVCPLCMPELSLFLVIHINGSTSSIINGGIRFAWCKMYKCECSWRLVHFLPVSSTATTYIQANLKCFGNAQYYTD